MDKQCSRCKLLKNVTDFNICNKAASGRCSRCRACEAEVKKHRRANRLGCYAYEHLRDRRSKSNRRNKKRKVISHYSGGLMKCAHCPYSDIRALTVDHIKNDGNIHRKQLKEENKNIYAWLIENGYPGGFQILCMNCQFIKEFERVQALKVDRDGTHAKRAVRDFGAGPVTAHD